MWGGGTDYSRDCGRTDLGELIYCGMADDFGRPEYPRPMFDENGFTAIIDGTETTGVLDEATGDGIYFSTQCATFGLYQESDSETYFTLRFELEGFNPEVNPCAIRDNYPNNHLALYYKAN